MPTIKLQTDDKPYLTDLMKDKPEQAKAIIGLFVELIEECIQNGWHELPELFGSRLTLSDLVKGVLHGALDLPQLNPEAYPVMKEEVHPFSMLVPRKNLIDGGLKVWNWREWYKLDSATPINQTTIETIIRKLLRYYRYVSVDDLAKALIYNQIKTFEGLGVRSVALLPFYPALRYQQRVFGDLRVGLLFDDVGFIDCGDWAHDDHAMDCPACGRPDIERMGSYHYCKACNAGWKDAVV